MNYRKHLKLGAVAVGLAAILVPTPQARAASAAEIRREAKQALHQLCATTPAARHLASQARAILVFPSIIKGGFMIGAQHADGALISDGHVAGYYKTAAASYGLQAGIQKYGYALFFMTDGDLAYLRKSSGWEIGTGPSIVIVDKGMAKTLTSTTLRKGVYAFAFGQRGLMAGLGLQGSKITRIHPD
jgi:lipid-binding SYLF domain-containing protein